MLAEGILLRWSEYEVSRNEQMSERIFMEKMIALDYADIDRQYVYDLYYQIRQNENWAGWGGRYAVQYIFEGVITSVSQIIGGLALSCGKQNGIFESSAGSGLYGGADVCLCGGGSVLQQQGGSVQNEMRR